MDRSLGPIKSKRPRRLPPIVVEIPAMYTSWYLFGCNYLPHEKLARLYCCGKVNADDIGNHRPICLLSAATHRLFTRVILNWIGRILDEEHHTSTQGLGEESVQSIVSLQ
ncbi:hypothetical protein V3C99_014835 [Haemonchus contortus]|uniref:Uncharacterized protein n=1 Tax=Haemonchus contortus TaxID=6289 RepID=A0A7I4YVG7_HAECO